MIHAAVSHIAGQLNQFLRRTCGVSEDMVVITNLVEQDGNVSVQASDKLVMFLVNIEKDTTPYIPADVRGAGHDHSERRPVPLFLNLYLMVACSFSGNNYPEGLKFISHTISFFQRQSTFDHQNSPDLDPGIQQLVLEIQNMDFQALSHLWGVLSGKYLPSVLYKVRLMTFDSEDIQARIPAVTTQQPEITPEP